MDLIKKIKAKNVKSKRDKRIRSVAKIITRFFELLPHIHLPKSKDNPLENFCFNDHISK